MRVVVAGYGPVAARLVEELLPGVRSGALSVLLVGEEPVAAYNRVLVADLAVGRTTAEALEISDAAELRASGVRVRLGERITHVDRARRLVLLGDGTSEPYDRLVFATGASATIPNLSGLNPDPAAVAMLPDGVTALRDLADAARLLEAVSGGGRIVVLGGGILGLEAALAAADEGASVTVVHHGPRPLARSIDRGGGSVLAAALRRRGIRMVSNARSTGVDLGTGLAGRRFRALQLDDGRRLEADLLLLSCGVRPRTELAAGCGLPVGSGILVDHRLQADADGEVFAVGDCAEVRCREAGCPDCAGGAGPSGLIGPGWRQAEWLAARLLADAGQQPPAMERLPAERPAVILLKARGVDVSTAGAVDAEPWDEAEPWDNESGSLEEACPAHPTTPAVRQVAVWADPEHGKYVKMVTRRGVLEGLVAVGMPRTAAELVLLFESGRALPADRSSLLRMDGADAGVPATRLDDPGATVCRCSGVSAGRIREAVSDGCGSLEEVAEATRAATGCGGCRERVIAVIAAHQASHGADLEELLPSA
ncbi:FAD-dependent oxidoreductase [Paenarthrobacter sp. DKR-5]|nr:FAD-dependent oxidoreductase [Paenarthrobacter sp. DKR-5]